MSLNKGTKKRYTVAAGTAGAYLFDSNALDSPNQNLTATALAALGISELDPATPMPAGAFLGANSPKPPKFKLDGSVAGQSTTTFAAIGTTLAAAREQNWVRVSSAKYKYPTATGQSRSVFVVSGGVNYAWNMHVDQYTQLTSLGVLTTLGIEDCDPDNFQSYVWGSTTPKPAQVSTIILSSPVGGGATNIDKIRTFCSQARENSLPIGWKIVKNRRDWSNI